MILRFTRAERAVHWGTAVAVLACAVTGFVLYVGWPPALIGRRTLLRDVHVVAGVLMPVPLVLAYLGRWRAAVRADVRRLARWTRADRRWLLSRGRDATGAVGKFNAGQKANAAFTAGMIPVMLVTGAIIFVLLSETVRFFAFEEVTASEFFLTTEWSPLVGA